MRWVDDVGVDELDFGSDLLEELRMPLLDVLAPEVGRFEELGAKFRGASRAGRWWWRRDLAAEFGGIFLLDELYGT